MGGRERGLVVYGNPSGAGEGRVGSTRSYNRLSRDSKDVLAQCTRTSFDLVYLILLLLLLLGKYLADNNSGTSSSPTTDRGLYKPRIRVLGLSVF